MSIIDRQIRADIKSRDSAEKKVERTTSLKPTIDEMVHVNQLIRDVSERYKLEVSASGIDAIRPEIEKYIKERVEASNLDYLAQNRIRKIATTNIFGLGPLEEFMQSESHVTDIVVGPYNHICVEDVSGMHLTDASFNSEEHLIQVINRIIQQVGRTLNLAHPMVDARLKDGSRVNATIPPISPDGATLTIRRFPEQSFTGEDFVRLHSLNEKMLFFLAQCVKGKASIIVSGGTSAGKTTVLNMLSSFIPNEELIITVEDDCELRLLQPNVRRMETRQETNEMGAITTRMLVKNCLRMRPDRIIVGEVRDETVVDMLSAMSTGHDGSMGTIHANSPRNLVNSRIPVLFSQYQGGVFSNESQQRQITEAVHIIVQVTKTPANGRKITNITVVEGLSENGVVLKDIFRYDTMGNKFIQTNHVPQKLLSYLERYGVVFDENFFQEGAWVAE